MRIVAMLAVVCAIGAAPALAQQGGMMPRGEGGMDGMMGQREMANLKALAPERAVEAVKYCDGQYFVRTKAGDVLEVSEFNLRLKSDASGKGPHQGKPALLPAGMMGDRAFLIFSDPAEISGYIKKECA